MDWIMSSQNVYVKILTSNAIFGDRVRVCVCVCVCVCVHAYSLSREMRSQSRVCVYVRVHLFAQSWNEVTEWGPKPQDWSL